MLAKGRSGLLFTIPWRARETVDLWATRPVGVLFCPAPPGPAAPMLLEGTSEACLLGGQFCWHPVLPDPAPPPRRAPRPDSPVVCPGFGLDRWFFQKLEAVFRRWKGVIRLSDSEERWNSFQFTIFGTRKKENPFTFFPSLENEEPFRSEWPSRGFSKEGFNQRGFEEEFKPPLKTSSKLFFVKTPFNIL